MKRKSIQSAMEVPFRVLVSLIQRLQEDPQPLVVEKMDGMFMSVGIDSLGAMFFQSSNSPRCYGAGDYIGWAKGDHELSRDIAAFGESLIDSTVFQRWVRVHAASWWPDLEYEFSFEFFPVKYQVPIDADRAVTIKSPHPFHTRDTIYLHDQKMLLLENDHDIPCAIRMPPQFAISVQPMFVWDAVNYYNEHLEFMDPKKKAGKEHRLMFRQLVNYALSATEWENHEFEGFIIEHDEKKIKVILRGHREKSLNPTLFKMEIPNGR